MPVKKLADAKQLPWKPRWSAHCRKEFKNARPGRKKVSQLYDHMCHLCGKLFPDVQSKEEHSDQHTTSLGGGEVRCNQCNTIHNTGKPIYRHVLDTHTGYNFHCLVDGCSVVRNDKKCIIDHHYVVHKLSDYKKIPPRFRCETKFIRRLAGVSGHVKDPDPAGKFARRLQPDVKVPRIPDDEMLFYLNFPDILGVSAGIKQVMNNYAFSPVKNEEGEIVVPLEPQGETEDPPFIKVLMTQEFADSLPQVLHQIPGLVDESVEPLIPLKTSETVTSLDSLVSCLPLITDGENIRIKEVRDVDIKEPGDRGNTGADKENIPLP